VKTRAFRILVLLALAVGVALSMSLLAQARTAGGDDDDDNGSRSIRGAGTTMVQGGTGPPSFTPLLTKVAFHWRNGSGHFECLALAPSVQAGRPGSGNFDTNVMYVTGPITSVSRNGHTTVLRGTSTVTGEGAGTNRPFTATFTRGGPGATFVLEVSGLTFREILLDGQFGS
jgi:hypothetical protein